MTSFAKSILEIVLPIWHPARQVGQQVERQPGRRA